MPVPPRLHVERRTNKIAAHFDRIIRGARFQNEHGPAAGIADTQHHTLRLASGPAQQTTGFFRRPGNAKPHGSTEVLYNEWAVTTTYHNVVYGRLTRLTYLRNSTDNGAGTRNNIRTIVSRSVAVVGAKSA